jgi:hypothetical protein
MPILRSLRVLSGQHHFSILSLYDLSRQPTPPENPPKTIQQFKKQCKTTQKPFKKSKRFSSVFTPIRFHNLLSPNHFQELKTANCQL